MEQKSSRKPRLLRKPEVSRLTSLSPSSIRRLEIAGQFPKRRRLGANSVAWLEREILDWIETREAITPGEDKD